MQKYLKNNKGFTLVEVIVVAVIVLILAAVAIPLYQGYIKDSRQASVENAAGALATALGAAVQTGQESWNQSSFTASQGGHSMTITAGPNSLTNQIRIPANMAVTIHGKQSVEVSHGAVTDVSATRTFGF